jgi:protein-S-isoprenylcysteine O-methyltransferase Ste14
MFGLLLATGLAAGQWIALVAASVLFIAGTWIRVRSEEQLLRQAFGPEFEDYQRRVPALIPGVY